MNLRIEDARGHCHDGAPSMKGANTVVATQFKLLNGKMLYVHRYGHALNLVLKDSCIKVKCLKETFEAYEKYYCWLRSLQNGTQSWTNCVITLKIMLKAFIPFVQRVGQFLERL